MGLLCIRVVSVVVTPPESTMSDLMAAITQVSGRVTQIGEHMTRMDGRMVRTDERMGGIERTTQILQRAVQEQHDYNRAQFNNIAGWAVRFEHRLAECLNSIRAVDTRVVRGDDQFNTRTTLLQQQIDVLVQRSDTILPELETSRQRVLQEIDVLRRQNNTTAFEIVDNLERIETQLVDVRRRADAYA